VTNDSASKAKPYRVFETERDYREHIARVVGWRIGREQDRTRQAERRAEAAERERNELAREVEELRRSVHT
jgi:hypothetical protein